MMLLKSFFIVICTLLLTTSIYSSQKNKPLSTQSLEDGETLETSFSKSMIPCHISLPETASAFHALSIVSIPIEVPLSRESSARNSPEIFARLSHQTFQPRWLLSLDGGGIRGLMQLQIIAEIERVTQKSIIELFDAVSGTSFGGIIASLLTMPDPLNPKKPKYSAQDLLNIFTARKNEIFKSKWQSCFGLFRTRYKTTPFINLLKDLFRNNKFSERLLPTVLVTHNLITNEEQLFSSKDSEDFYTWAIAAATGATPTYFKPQRIFPVDSHPYHRGYVLSDGSTCMNNPTMAGITLMHDIYKVDLDDLNVLSLGAGTSGTSQLNTKLLRGGSLSWGVVIANTCVAGQASSTNKLAELYCKEKYHRLNPIVDPNNMALDNISDENLDTLFAATHLCIKDNQQELKEIFEELSDSADSKKYAEIQTCNSDEVDIPADMNLKI